MAQRIFNPKGYPMMYRSNAEDSIKRAFAIALKYHQNDQRSPGVCAWDGEKVSAILTDFIHYALKEKIDFNLCLKQAIQQVKLERSVP